jgi:hypothetical protein
MMEEIKASSTIPRSDSNSKLQETASTRDISLSTGLQNHRQISIMDLERNILQAKGLRVALCVRIVHTKSQADAVLYVLRVEDVETGLQWVVHRRYRDFHSLHEELSDMNSLVKDIAFPKKSMTLRSSAALIESRIVALEQYIRRVLHLLTLYATMDPQASRSLRHVQSFLGVDKYIDCIHPPLTDDQRFIELMAYRFLNDFNSPACQQCVRFVTTVDLDDILLQSLQQQQPATTTSPNYNNAIDPIQNPNGYREVLSHMHDALAEVETFVIQQHSQQMALTLRERREDVSSEDIRVFVRKCVRRQVEAALYMPLRRTIFRIVYSFIAIRSSELQRDMMILQHADPSFFMIDPYVRQAKGLSKAIKAFRDVIQAYLPSDQCQLLMHAAAAVAELHTECLQYRREHPLPPPVTATGTAPSSSSSAVAELPPPPPPPTEQPPVSIAIEAESDPSQTESQSRRSSVDISTSADSLPQQRARKSFDGSSGNMRASMSFDFGKMFNRRNSMSNVIDALSYASISSAMNISASTKSPRASCDPNNTSTMATNISDSRLTNRMTLADPVKEMFTMDETVPGENILRDQRIVNRSMSESSERTESPVTVPVTPTNVLASPSDQQSTIKPINDPKAWNALQQLLEPPIDRQESMRRALDIDDPVVISDNHDVAVLIGVATSTTTSTNTSPYNSTLSMNTSSSPKPAADDYLPNEQESKTSIESDIVNADYNIPESFEAENRRISQESNITAGFFEVSLPSIDSVDIIIHLIDNCASSLPCIYSKL